MTVNRVLDSERVRRHIRLPEGRVPVGYRVHLPGRGTTHVTDTAGPPGAPTLLLLHGAGSTGALSWYPALDALRRHFRVVTMDQRGHGGGIDHARFTLRDCADDVASLVDELRLGRVLVMGHSMGSVVAQRVWRQHPSLVSGLVLCSTTDRFRSSPSEVLFFGAVEVSLAVTRLTAPRRLARRAPRPGPDGVGAEVTVSWAVREWRRCQPRGVAQAVVACGRHHSAPWLSSIDVPTAVVVTTEDRVIAPERQRAIAERIPGATVHEVAAGHTACTDAADRFVPVATQAAVLTARRAGYRTGVTGLAAAV